MQSQMKWIIYWNNSVLENGKHHISAVNYFILIVAMQTIMSEGIDGINSIPSMKDLRFLNRKRMFD